MTGSRSRSTAFVPRAFIRRAHFFPALCQESGEKFCLLEGTSREDALNSEGQRFAQPPHSSADGWMPGYGGQK
jgi:hypothetical protein